MTDRKPDKAPSEAFPSTSPRDRLGRDIQSKIGQQLRSMYDDVVSSGVPDRFSYMLQVLDQDRQDIQETARETFGDYEFAQKWLALPNPALGNRVPIEIAATDSGRREVRAILARIAYGDYS